MLAEGRPRLPDNNLASYTGVSLAGSERDAGNYRCGGIGDQRGQSLRRTCLPEILVCPWETPCAACP